VTAARVPRVARTLSDATARRWFLGAVGVTLAFRLWLAAWLPLTGDEAYFVYWGAVPAAGFYDHPPMVGWMLAGLLAVSDAEWWLRLPQVVLPAAIAWGIARLARPVTGAAIAWLAATAYLVAPVQVINVAVTTDTPLLAFSFLSVAAFVVAVRRDSLAWAALAGLMLGGAILSKFFAAPLAFAYLGYVLATPSWRRRWAALAVIVLAALPAALYLLWWNYVHCWANVMFNLYIRHGDAGLAWGKPLKFAAFLLYATSPLLVWHLVRRVGAVRASLADPAVRLAWFAALVPFALFAALSLVKNVGLHWLFAFVPALFLGAAFVLDAATLRLNVLFLAVVSALHAAVTVTLAVLPIESFARLKQYDGIVMTFAPEALLAELAPFEREGFVLMADGYSPAVTLAWGAREAGFRAAAPGTSVPREYVGVFGAASPRARQDDILTDFRKLDGKDILIVRKTRADDQQYRPYFDTVEFRDLTVRGATFHLVIGRGFRYAPYRDGVLTEVRDRFYRIPAYLPQGACWVCERYFGTATCPAR
jgi:4-amino-4-deoxy-L-arabinose transferase-like glycosyltransferase